MRAVLIAGSLVCLGIYGGCEPFGERVLGEVWMEFGGGSILFIELLWFECEEFAPDEVEDVSPSDAEGVCEV